MKNIIIDYYDLPIKVLEQLKVRYPYGFSQNLITHEDEHDNEYEVLPFTFQHTRYLVKMTEADAELIIEEDNDYNALGNLKEEMKKKYQTDDSAIDEDSIEGQRAVDYDFDEFV